MYEWILTTMLAWPQPYIDKEIETIEERSQRIEMIAHQTEDAVNEAIMTGLWPGHRRWELASIVLGMMKVESWNLSVKVHTGSLVGDMDETSLDRRGSWCLAQINVVWIKDDIDSFIGTDENSTFACIKKGIEVLAWNRENCESRGFYGVDKIHTAYTYGYRCETSEDGAARARITRKALRASKEWRGE